MRLGTRMLRLGAVLPGVVLSAALLLVVTVSLPATLGGMLLVAYVVAAAVVALGRFEAPMAQVLGRARRATAGEEQMLQGLTAWLRSQGCPTPDLYVARSDLGRAAAEPCGRRSVVVAPRMLRWLHRQQVPQHVAAAIVAQAAAGLQVGPSRFDLAVRLLTAPGALVLAGLSRVARLFTWMPGVLGLWRIRAVVGIAAVWQCLEARQVTIAVTTGVLITVSCSSPACGRAWRRRVEAASDRLVAKAGLGEQLAYAIRSADERGCVDRVHRIRAAAQECGQCPDHAINNQRTTLHQVR